MAVTFAENIRAYTSRSFEQPFYIDFWTNVSMQYAILMAETAMWFVLFCPFVSEVVFELEGKHLSWHGFAFALSAAVACVIFCELYKFFVKANIRKWKDGKRAMAKLVF